MRSLGAGGLAVGGMTQFSSVEVYPSVAGSLHEGGQSVEAAVSCGPTSEVTHHLPCNVPWITEVMLFAGRGPKERGDSSPGHQTASVRREPGPLSGLRGCQVLC